MTQQEKKEEEETITLPTDEQLNNAIQKIEQQENKPKIDILDINDFINNTHKFWNAQPFFFDNYKTYWFWNENHTKWERGDETDILNCLDTKLDIGNKTIMNFIKNGYLEAIRRLGRQKIPKQNNKEWIQYKNKIININTGETKIASPQYFVTNPIPWQIGLSENTPNLDRIFSEWVGEKYVRTLYEIIAYCTLPDYPLHRIFALIGSGSNGKSKFLQIIEKFIGPQNICSTDLHLLMKNRFESTKLYKKLVCFMGETNCKDLDDTMLLKRLTTDTDVIGFEFKGKEGFDDHNYAKLILASNSLPETVDKTDGFKRRWLIIEFNNKFSEKKDILRDIPDNEYESLANKSIKILKFLLEKREFTNEGTVEERGQKYEDKSNPLQKFLKDIVIGDVNGNIPKFEFKQLFQAWQGENGYRIWTEHQIGKKMKESYEEGRPAYQVRGVNNLQETKYYPSWLGISWIIPEKKKNFNDFNDFNPSYIGTYIYNTKLNMVEKVEKVENTYLTEKIHTNSAITPEKQVPQETKTPFHTIENISDRTPQETNTPTIISDGTLVPNQQTEKDILIFLQYLNNECETNTLEQSFPKKLIQKMLKEGTLYQKLPHITAILK